MYKRVLAVVVMFLVSVVLTNGGIGVSFAAEKKKTTKAKPVQSKEKEEAFDAHAPTVRYHFKDTDMDWSFGFLLGTTSNHGFEIGEAYYTASQIKDGDAASWQAEWIKTADRLAARAEKALADGHKISAIRQMQRASLYYRASIMTMMPDDARVKESAKRSRSLLRKAGALMDPPLEYFQVPFEGTVLPGYFRKADNSGALRPTLFMIGGGEPFAEDNWFHIAPQTFERGYNFITVDLPGQGLLPWEGKFFRPAMHVPISSVIDYALKRPEVDPQRFYTYGISGGGGFAPPDRYERSPDQGRGRDRRGSGRGAPLRHHARGHHNPQSAGDLQLLPSQYGQTGGLPLGREDGQYSRVGCGQQGFHLRSCQSDRPHAAPGGRW